MSRFPSFVFRVAACGVLVLGVMTAASAQQVYRWVDVNGVVHYSDQPPPDKKSAQVVNVRTSKSAKLSPEEIAAADAAEKAKPEAIQAAKKVQDDAQRAKYCQTARVNLLALNSGNEVTQDFDGMRRALTPEERAAQIEKNQRIVDANCSATADSEG